MVWETALATVTGRGRGGNSVLSSFRHLSVGLAFDVDVARNIGTDCSPCHTTTVSPALSVLGENAAMMASLRVEKKLLLANRHFASSCDFPVLSFTFPWSGMFPDLH